MFYVYHGYVSPDNYDSSERPTYQLSSFHTEDEVIAFKEEFEAELHDECMKPIFRVITGREMSLKPVETVTTWKLS
jgi:hypothetical protein